MRANCQHCAVDIHAHFVPREFPRCIGSDVPDSWPSSVEAHACHRHVMISGEVYRTVSDLCWDVEKRAQNLNDMALHIQALSPMPELLAYWMRPSAGSQLCRFLNYEIANAISKAPDRYVGLGAVPLQDIDLAIMELRHIMETPGFVGVEVGSNVNGVAIGHPQFDPFLQACEALGAAVFVHALRPTGMDRLIGPAALQQVLAYPSDVGLAAASVITSNVMERWPNLRLAFSHGGGTLVSLLPRLEQGYIAFPKLKDTILASPTKQAQKLYFDTLVFDPRTLQHLLDCFGDTQLLIGTDFPFNFSDRTPVDRIGTLALGADQAENILYKNAHRFLGLQTP